MHIHIVADFLRGCQVVSRRPDSPPGSTMYNNPIFDQTDYKDRLSSNRFNKPPSSFCGKKFEQRHDYYLLLHLLIIVALIELENCPGKSPTL